MKIQKNIDYWKEEKSMHINEDKGKGHHNYFFKNGVEKNKHN